ncbi:MAG: hypothetical protein QME66_03065 [Candidatus Eisenbacteria bacterium]|nr:hypothetical protein [Candidatus Eisenbacteria bacterium]
MRKEIPLFITALFGGFMVLEFFVPHPMARDFGQTLQQWTIIITAFSYVLGAANIVRINGNRVFRKQKDWGYAIPLLIGFAVMTFFGVGFGVGEGTVFDGIFNGVYVPMQATMFSLLAFFIASAAFRAFRIRSFEASLLAVAAVLVMIGRVPVGGWLGGILGSAGAPSEISDWIMNVPNLAAKRAIMIGAALGAISTGLKIILGIERNYLGGE